MESNPEPMTAGTLKHCATHHTALVLHLIAGDGICSRIFLNGTFELSDRSSSESEELLSSSIKLKCGHGADALRSSNRLAFIDIDLDKDYVGILLRKPLKFRCDRSTWSVKIGQNENVMIREMSE